jgi:hypothetical protein
VSITSDKLLLVRAAKNNSLVVPKGFRWAVPTMGPQAVKLVEDFQRAFALPVTGVIDERTRVELRREAIPLRERALDIMLQMEKHGVHETTKNRSPFIDYMKEYVNGYTDSEPWCADAVTYCYKKASENIWPKQGCFNHRYCPSWLDTARRSLCGLGIITRNIRKGDVVLFDWDGDGIADHVGLVRISLPGVFRVTAGPIPTTEGNTGATDSGLGFGDGVHSKWRTRKSVIAFVKVEV